jgi:protein gp37
MSKIEWTGKTWNPIVGCSRISEGCRHCYAARMARRLAAMGQAKYQGAVDEHGRWNGQVWFDAPSYDLPLKVKAPTVWFVNSMSDLFHEGVSINWIMRVWDVMKDCPQHTFQILTKRAERLGKLLAADGVLTATYGVLPNVWLGVSVENQAAADERIPWLVQAQAAIRFLSCEPLLGPVELGRWLPPAPGVSWAHEVMEAWGEDTNKIDWVICGGESGPGARPMSPDWARALRDQCTAAGVPFFMKQWGEWLPNAQEYGCHQSGVDYNRPHTLVEDVAMARVEKRPPVACSMGASGKRCRRVAK